MTRFQRILCPVDRSEPSATALHYGTMLAQWYDASLTALEMVWLGIPAVQPLANANIPDSSPIRQAYLELREFVDAHRPAELAVECLVREGQVVHGILDEVRRLDADLLVLGTHGRSGFERLVLGSVAEKVLRLAPCPVFVVPRTCSTAPPAVRAFQTVLCAVDFSPASLRARDYALSLAEESGKRLILLHVIEALTDQPVRPGLGPVTNAARRRYEQQAIGELGALVTDDDRKWCDCRELTAMGRPYEQILRIAAEHHADLVVVGVHGRTNLEVALFGSTTTQLVRRATCPVLTVHP